MIGTRRRDFLPPFFFSSINLRGKNFDKVQAGREKEWNNKRRSRQAQVSSEKQFSVWVCVYSFFRTWILMKKQPDEWFV